MARVISFELPPVEEIAETIGVPFERWAKQCHAISIAIVKAGVVPKGSRVARGSCGGVGSQHSWIVVQVDGSGELADVYAPDALIVDPTLWSYREEIEGIWVGRTNPQLRTKPGTPALIHTPHGAGPHIMSAGRPDTPREEPVPLAHAARQELSAEALWWVDAMFGPLDRAGWAQVASMTVTGWPAAEVITAMVATPQLKTLVPIDRVGMLTDLNPEGLYF